MPEPTFVPKAGQTDYTNIRYAPVVNVVVAQAGKILLVQRSRDLRFYPGFWHCVAGFLDDSQSIEDKAREELREELGLTAADILGLERAQPVLVEAPEYAKTYLVVPVMARVNTAGFTLDWEASRARWVTPAQARRLKLVPGFAEVLARFFAPPFSRTE